MCSSTKYGGLDSCSSYSWSGGRRDKYGGSDNHDGSSGFKAERNVSRVCEYLFWGRSGIGWTCGWLDFRYDRLESCVLGSTTFSPLGRSGDLGECEEDTGGGYDYDFSVER
jgi:hypothetical protein